MSNLLNKEQILSADDLQTKDILVKPWGGYVRVRTMTAHERDQFEQKVFAGRDKKGRMDDIRATLVSLAVVDENGKRIFTDKDVAGLAKKSAAAMDQIFAEVQKLNAVTDEDVEDMAKNSEETQDDSSDGE